MLNSARHRLKQVLEAQLGDEVLASVDRLQAQLNGRQTDDFGFSPEQLKWVLPLSVFLYRYWFRVETVGLENVPGGRALFVSNHSGQIPIDGAMIGTALMVDAEPPRAPRSMIERWVPSLPYVSTFLARVGQVLGTPENCRRMLEQGASVIVFPEGSRGISKTIHQAYQLQTFGHGFMRLALETRTPIVPVAVIGAEEQYPAIWNMTRLAKALGMPAFPIVLNPFIPFVGLLPLPVKYRIYFGQPMLFEGDPEEDELQITKKVSQVREEIDALIQRGLEQRSGFFK
ncbi:MAG: lysophospholipid acyltransferase family protein [Myxococcota bacterium]|nr:lysophospholipid acyltransferase family protein [Myxococcota bacterium]